ncbi:MAG: DUF6602 domain-containing protein [Armatimonadota bacterium]
MNKAFRNVFDSRIAATLAAAVSVEEIEHNGIKGLLREVVIRDLLKPLLPPDIGIGTGVIVAPSGDRIQSRQTDIIIYDKSIVPAMLFDDSQGLFPVDSVFAVIEVKSKLDAAELRKSYAAAKRLYEMKHIHNGISTLTAIFAFSSNMKKGNELQRYQRYGDDNPTTSAVRSICVVGKGYWYATGDSWEPFPWVSQADYGYIVAFLLGIVRMFPHIKESRQRNPDESAQSVKYWPYLSDLLWHYLLD